MRSRCSGSGFAQLAPALSNETKYVSEGRARPDVQSLPGARDRMIVRRGETEFQEQTRSQTGVWEREGKIEESGEGYVQISRRDPSLRAGLAYRSG
jgi:hypothetical protein